MRSTSHSLMNYLRMAVGAWRDDPRDDATLLARFAESGDEAVFRALVWRHGPLVWQTCRRVLGDTPDAEDAFQAAFLTLARKAKRLRREPLAGWLHQVARQAAMDVQISARRRRALEQRLRAVKQPAEEGEVASRSDLYAVLDEELAGLPERLQVPLLLHYLEGRSQVEVARLLGCTRRALQKRLTQGEAILRERLERRGLAMGIGTVTALLTSSVTASALPARLIGSTAQAAVAFRSGVLTGGAAEAARAVLGALPSPLGTTIMRKSLWIVLACSLGLAGASLVAWGDLPVRPEKPAEAGSARQRPVPAGEKQARIDHYGDALPQDALARLGTTRLRHGALVIGVLFTPDGKTVASAGMDDDTMRLWEVTTGKLLRSLKHPTKGPRLVSFIQEGETLVSADSKKVRLWDVKTGKQFRELTAINASVAVSPDDKTVASESGSGTISLWDLATGKQLHILHGHEKSVGRLSFSPDSKMLAAASREGTNGKTVRLWEVKTGKLLHKLEHPPGTEVSSLSFLSDGEILASGGSDQNSAAKPAAVRLWDVATGKLLRSLQGHQGGINSFSFSPDGKTLASGSSDDTIRLWDVTTGKELRQLQCPMQRPRASIHSLSFSPDNKTLAAGVGPMVRLWDATTGQELCRQAEAHSCTINALSFSSDGKIVATGGGDRVVRLWDGSTGRPLRVIEHPQDVSSVALAPHGELLASCSERAKTIWLWDTATSKQVHKLKGHENGVVSVAFSPDGKTLASVSVGEKTVRLWEKATGKQLHKLEQSDFVYSVAFAPDGKTVAVGGRDLLSLWDVATGKALGPLHIPKKNWVYRCNRFALPPDGKLMAVVDGSTIHLLDRNTGEERGQFWGGVEGLVSTVAFSPNGQMLASGGTDGMVRLWEMHGGAKKECHTFRGHQGYITALVFSPDGRRLVSASADSTALIWDVTGQAGKPRQPTPEELAALWHTLASPDGAKAYEARRRLAAMPEQTVTLLTKHLLLQKPDAQQTTRLLAELNSNEFATRTKAMKELRKYGTNIVPALQKALKDKPSVEVPRRIKELLEEIDPKEESGVSLGLLRLSRAVEVLEWLGDAAARQLLQKVVALPPREEIGQQAQAILRRLNARASFTQP